MFIVDLIEWIKYLDCFDIERNLFWRDIGCIFGF